MLQDILNVIFYIPRKIYNHFDEFNCMKQERIEQDIIIDNQRKLFKIIVNECDYNMRINNYRNSYSGFNKIKELAKTFPQEQD